MSIGKLSFAIFATILLSAVVLAVLTALLALMGTELKEMIDQFQTGAKSA